MVQPKLVDFEAGACRMVVGASTYVVEPAQRQVTRALAERAAATLSRPDGDDAPSGRNLPAPIQACLTALVDGGSPTGVVVLRGIAFDRFDDLPDTPVRPTAMLLPEHWTSGLLVVVARLLGAPVGYADEKDGALIHEVHPVRGEEQHLENTGTVLFGLHTENVHHPLRPDFLGLLCLRQDHERNAALRIATAREAVGHLSAADVRILRAARFRSRYPSSFTRGVTGDRPYTGWHPILFGPQQRPLMRFNSHNTEAADAEAETALRAFAAALDDVSEGLLLEPGDLVVLDNHVVAHGRAAFRSRYDGSDRWMRRFFAVRGLPGWASAMMPRPGVLPPLHELASGL